MALHLLEKHSTAKHTSQASGLFRVDSPGKYIAYRGDQSALLINNSFLSSEIFFLWVCVYSTAGFFGPFVKGLEKSPLHSL